MNENLIKLRATHSYTLFPKFPVELGTEGNEYGVVSWTVNNVEDYGEGITPPRPDSRITITGNYADIIEKDIVYNLIAKRTEHPKYGEQYQLIYFAEDIDFTNVSNQKAFLEEILSKKQIESLYSVCENPLDAISKHDVATLCKAPGIKAAIAQKIINRFEEHKDECEIFIKLDGYGLTPTFIRKLINHYNNPKKVIDTVLNRPYDLCMDCDGIGFKTADNIARKGGVQLTDVSRIKAFIYTCLHDYAMDGNSYLLAGALNYQIFENLGSKEDILVRYDTPDKNGCKTNIAAAIHELQADGFLGMTEDDVPANRRVYLTRFHKLESNVAFHLSRIARGECTIDVPDWKERVAQQEMEQGWTLTDEQTDGVEKCLKNQLVVITGAAGCVDCDTEFFNGREWKRIADYEMGEKVLQYNEDGSANLVYPYNYIKQQAKQLWHFETKYGLDQCLSDNHNCYYITSKNNLYSKSFKEIRESHEKGAGFTGRFITTFSYDENGIALSDAQIRLMVAAFADASFNYQSWSDTTYCMALFHLKKQRKIDRVIQLAKEAETTYTVTSRTKGYTDVKVMVPFRGKHFPKDWYQCSSAQKQVIADEVMLWDGKHKQNNHYSTVSKQDADFIQFVFSSLGYRATIGVQDRRGQTHITDGKAYEYKSIEYTVSYNKRTLIGMCSDIRANHIKTPITPYPTVDGYEYCFTVPSHMLVLRRNNKIFITGNCGKTATLSAVLRAMGCIGRTIEETEDGQSTVEAPTFAQCSLSGKAAARMEEVTHHKGSTIHRLLGYNPMEGGFQYDTENLLPYRVIVLDEISMVGGDIFLALLKAIPTGAKLIILGDMGQLESIGCMNIAHDLFYCPEVIRVTLTKIHRQAQKSGIILASHAVRNSERMNDLLKSGVHAIGELQDMVADISTERDESQDKVVQYFKEAYYDVLNDGGDVMDVQVLTTVKERGDVSVSALNKLLQEIVNPQTRFLKKELAIESDKEERSFVLREGDKVLCVRNNYRIVDINGDPTSMFNGWVGIIEKIDVSENKCIIYFQNAEKRVSVTCAEAKNSIQLGYACTVHKYQGSQAHTVIGVLDYTTPPQMLTKEMLYTMLTRAERRCVLVGQSGAISKAISSSGVADKNTFLLEMLSANLQRSAI